MIFSDFADVLYRNQREESGGHQFVNSLHRHRQKKKDLLAQLYPGEDLEMLIFQYHLARQQQLDHKSTVTHSDVVSTTIILEPNSLIRRLSSAARKHFFFVTSDLLVHSSR